MATAIDLPQTAQRLTVRAGDVVLFPPGTLRRFHYHAAGWHRALHVQVDLALGLPSPQHWQASPGTARLATALDEVIQAAQESRRRAAAWWALWLLRDLEELAATGANHDFLAAGDAVQRAETHIAHHLAEPLQVEAVVRAAGISHNQLLRRFHARHAMGIVCYIRARRMAMAEELLRQSDLPIAVIAAEIGIPDRQYFNKTVRRYFGCPPSALRRVGQIAD